MAKIGTVPASLLGGRLDAAHFLGESRAALEAQIARAAAAVRAARARLEGLERRRDRNDVRPGVVILVDGNLTGGAVRVPGDTMDGSSPVKFEQFEYDFPAPLRARGFVDTSYHSDVCASAEGHGVRVWVMPPDPADREDVGNGTTRESKQFWIERLGTEDGEPLLETESLEEVLAFVDGLAAGAAPAAVDGAACDECEALIPAVDGGSLANRHHAASCSLFDGGAA